MSLEGHSGLLYLLIPNFHASSFLVVGCSKARANWFGGRTGQHAYEGLPASTRKNTEISIPQLLPLAVLGPKNEFAKVMLCSDKYVGMGK